jgi:anaerobic ribonucleoside-triphosphate reductase-like protein
MSIVLDLPNTVSSVASVALKDEERQRCEVWTRVMGYHRPVSSFNTGKKGEFNERQYFEEWRCSDSTASQR